jgi:hypothetical protein
MDVGAVFHISLSLHIIAVFFGNVPIMLSERA